MVVSTIHFLLNQNLASAIGKAIGSSTLGKVCAPYTPLAIGFHKKISTPFLIALL
jgi:hypothetical protein